MKDLPYKHYDPHQLSFRRQFVLGPQFVERFAHWQRLRIGATMCATVHPDLVTCQQSDGERSVTLFGFILDPRTPAATNAEIVAALLAQLRVSADLDSFLETTYIFGGRWVLIVRNGTEVRLFHDATGLRPVFYTKSAGTPEGWCGSDSRIIADILGLAPDPEAADFIASTEHVNPEYWWPGDRSPFSGVRRLLPNHYLDLKTHSPHRYWPNSDLREISVASCVQQSSDLLKRLMRSASNRFPLALTVTAGWDSRLALAACRAIKDRVWYFTLMYWDLSPQSDDIRIPASLLPKLGLQHHVIKCPPVMDSAFRETYHGNVAHAHDVYGTIAQGLFDSFPRDTVMVKAVVSEAARCVYQPKLPDVPNSSLTPLMIAHAVEMQASPFVIAAYADWLAGARTATNVDVLDLLFWEQRMGSWQSTSQLEWDIVQDAFTPFNCRTLLTQMLSVHRDFREYYHPTLYSELMQAMWPDVLSEPINPSKYKKTVRKMVQTFVSHSRMRQFVPHRIRSLGGKLLYPERRFSRER